MPTNPSNLHEMSSDLAVLLATAPELRKIWDTLTPLAQNEWICWVTIVKKAETRQAHLTRLSEDLLRGKRRPCCWPGCPHHKPGAAKWFGKKSDRVEGQPNEV